MCYFHNGIKKIMEELDSCDLLKIRMCYFLGTSSLAGKPTIHGKRLKNVHTVVYLWVLILRK